MYILLLGLCISYQSFSQHRLSGTVSESGGAEIYFATIALYNQLDSVLYNGTTTDEQGYFELENIKNGTYYLEARMLGYKSITIENLNFPTTKEQKISLVLSEDIAVLSTVEVTAKVPLLEQKIDRLVVNVAENVTSLNGNLLDVMKKVPGVLVMGNKLSMAGQPSVTILLNGKSTKYLDVNTLLRNMPGDNIQRIEVIHQPGAEFDAEGTGAVINIILKRNSRLGTSGQVDIGIAKGNDWKYTTGISLNHYQGDLNISGRVGFKNYPEYEETRITRRVGGDTYSQESIDPYFNTSVNIDLGVDWNITDQQQIGFQNRYLDWSSKNTIITTTNIDFLAEESEDLELTTDNISDETWQLLTINPYYRFIIDTTGHQLNFDVNLIKIKSGGGSILQSESNSLNQELARQQFLQPGKTNIFTAQLDYVNPFSKNLKLLAGVKYSDASLDNNLIVLDEVQDEWKKDVNQSNHFLFDERIKAIYTKVEFNKNKWAGTVGLRYEESNSKGVSLSLDSVLTRDISKLFPSASLSREITKELGTTFNYSYRIERPRYSTLNPFVYFLDPFTFERGNPTLRPALTHSMKLNLTYEKQPFFGIGYKISNDAMVEVTEQNDVTGEASLTTVNLESLKNLNFKLLIPIDFLPGVSGYGGLITAYRKYDSEYLNEQFLRSKWDFTGFVQTSFNLPGKINSEVSAWYNSGGQEGIMNTSWTYGVDVGFSKKIFADKAKISFGVENLFARYLHADIQFANMDATFYNRWDGPVFNFQFSYKFGNQSIKSKNQSRTAKTNELDRAQKK